jgi:hypothetical protein
MSTPEERNAELAAWYRTRENVTYTDGTQVREGDQIRYHQAPGGLMAHGDWRYGVAARLPEDRQGRTFPINELHLLAADGHYYTLFGHVIERVDITQEVATG